MKGMIFWLAGFVVCCGLWGAGTSEVVADESENKTPAPLRTLPHQGRVQRELGGVDVRGVRAQPSPAAAEAGAELGAEAYAKGQDVAFGSGGVDPEVVAAETAHVVQSGPKSEVKEPED